jgi:hypothetical protein
MVVYRVKPAEPAGPRMEIPAAEDVDIQTPAASGDVPIHKKYEEPEKAPEIRSDFKLKSEAIYD